MRCMFIVSFPDEIRQRAAMRATLTTRQNPNPLSLIWPHLTLVIMVSRSRRPAARSGHNQRSR